MASLKRGRTDNDEGSPEFLPHFLEEAMDVVSEYIFVAYLLPFSSHTPQDYENKHIQLGETKYMSGSLKKTLNLPPNSVSLSPPGKLYDLVYNADTGEYKGKGILDDSNNQQIVFFAVGKFNHERGLCFFRFIGTKDESYMLKQMYYKCDFMMTIFENRGDDGEFEWQHVLPNTCFLRYYPVREKMCSYTAKERYKVEERMKFYEAMDQSKRSGKSIEVERIEVSGFLLPPGVFVTYLYTDPNTNRDIASTIIFDGDVLRAARARIAELKDFFEHAPMMMGVVELRGDHLVLLYCNSETLPFMRDHSAQSVVIDEENDAVLVDSFIKLYRESRQTMKVVQADMDDVSTNRYISVIVSTISYDQENDVSKHVYMCLDKTKQRTAEVELERYKDSLEEKVQQRTLEVQEKEIQLRHLISNAPNIILTVDRDGIVQYANRHFVSDDGEFLLGKYLYTMVVEGPELKGQLNNLFETKKSFKGCEVKLIENDIWLNLSAGTINEQLAIVIATDISELKRMSEELNLALATKSRFLANMSHEVRTPLSGIIGMSRILQETGLTSDQTECVSTIQYCGETLLSVINSILDYTKLEAAGNGALAMTLDRSEISLQNCLEESLYAILPVARQKKLELILDIDSRVPDRILGDIIRLRQVMLNLLNNAVKFTDVGYVQVTLSGSPSDTEDWKFNFAIRDTGCGVPQESQGKLFQMFSQVDVSSTRRYGGTGIGLALAKRFLQMMNGDISMQSSGIPGEGSTFLFSISATPAPFVPLSPSHLSPRWLTSSTHVHIIESCKVASEVLKKRLLGKGFSSIEIISEGIPEAFEKIRTHSAALENSNIVVFCDIESLVPNQPYQLRDCGNVATVFMGYMRPQAFDTDFPMHEFLRKPIKESMLIACLREIWIKFFDKPRRLAPPTPPTPPALPKQINPIPLPLNILVAEDNEVNQKVVKRVFQHLGYHKMAIAINGMEALNWIDQNGLPDMILMDIQMPVLDGIQTTRLIREKYPASKVFIVAMTANAFPEDKKSCFDAGMNDFLTKPLRMEQLQTMLQKCYKQTTPTHNLQTTNSARNHTQHMNVP